MVCGTPPYQDAAIQQTWISCLKSLRIHSGNNYSRNEVRDEGHNDSKRVRETPPFKDASTHQIWDSYLKLYKICCDTIILGKGWVKVILEIRPEIKVNVTVTQNKVHDIPPFKDASTNQMWNSYLKFRRYAPEMTILETGSKVKVTVTPNWYVTLRHLKMHPHTKVGIPTSNKRYATDTNILKTRSLKSHSD